MEENKPGKRLDTLEERAGSGKWSEEASLWRLHLSRDLIKHVDIWGKNIL